MATDERRQAAEQALLSAPRHLTEGQQRQGLARLARSGRGLTSSACLLAAESSRATKTFLDSCRPGNIGFSGGKHARFGYKQYTDVQRTTSNEPRI